MSYQTDDRQQRTTPTAKQSKHLLEEGGRAEAHRCSVVTWDALKTSNSIWTSTTFSTNTLAAAISHTRGI